MSIRYRYVHVVTSFIMYNSRVLILRRSDRVRSMKGKWAGISGYIEKGEMDERGILERAYREIEEETGISRDRLVLARRCGIVYAYEHDTTWVVHPFLFLLKAPTVIRLDWEHDAYEWVESKRLAEYDTVPMLKEALECCMKGLTETDIDISL